MDSNGVVGTDSSCILESASDSRREIIRIRLRPDDPPAKKAKTSASQIEFESQTWQFSIESGVV